MEGVNGLYVNVINKTASKKIRQYGREITVITAECTANQIAEIVA